MDEQVNLEQLIMDEQVNLEQHIMDGQVIWSSILWMDR